MTITITKTKGVDSPPSGRELSTIPFPYIDLETGIEVAKAILDAGAVPLTRDQLANRLNMSTNSGAFLNKLAGAKMFGFVNVGSGTVSLTELAFAVLETNDEERVKQAKSIAFLNVPLFKRVYEEFRGKQLPPRPHGLEFAFVNFGVSNKQKSTARGTFDRSAQQAGYFPEGRQDRLVAPIIKGRVFNESVAESISAADAVAQTSNVTMNTLTTPGAPATPGPTLHPFIQGLIDALPPKGQEWAVEDRVDWLQAAANNFTLMYGPGKIKVTRATD